MQIDIVQFIEKFGWLVAIIFILILNGDKVAARLGTFIPPLANWLEKRRTEHEVLLSAQVAAKIEQDGAVLHHEFDSEAANQSHQMRQSAELMGILKQTLQHYWEEDVRQAEQLERLYRAMLSMESAVKLQTMTVAEQASAYGNLECVQAERRAERKRKTNGD